MYLGLWYGGPNYSTGSWRDDTEVFYSIEEAERVLQERDSNTARYNSGTGPDRIIWREDQKIITPGGRLMETPCVGNSELHLVALRTDLTLYDLESGYPNIILTLDSEGYVVQEDC